jgi:hypothetical protein
MPTRMREIDRHVDSETLEAYSMGMSSQEETAFVEEHLLICETCQERLDETDSYVALMRMVAQQARHDVQSS